MSSRMPATPSFVSNPIGIDPIEYDLLSFNSRAVTFVSIMRLISA